MKKDIVRNLELGITFLLVIYYLGPAIPSPVNSALALVGYLAVPLLVMRHWRRFIYVATRDILLLLLTGIAIISILWSASPELTLANSRSLLCSTAFGIYLATRYPPKEQMRLMLWLFGICTFLNLVVPLILPSYGTHDQFGQLVWQGISAHKNHLSFTMLMAVTLFLDMSLYGRRYRWAALTGAGIACIILVLSQGKGCLAISIGLLPLLPFYNFVKQEYRLKTFLCICGVLIGGVLITAALANVEFIVVDFLGKDLGGNGRDQLWTYVTQRGMEKPWLGYGYAGFWFNPDEIWGVSRYTWMKNQELGQSHSHSGSIDLFLQLGWLGISLMILSFLTVLIRVLVLLGLTKQIEYFWMLQFLLILVISNLTDGNANFLAPRSLSWVLYISTACSTAIYLNRNRIVKIGNKLVNSHTS